MTSLNEASGSPPSQPASAAGTARGDGAVEAFLARLFVPPVGLPAAHAGLVLGTVAALAVWTDALFNGAGLGVNATLWFASLALAAVVVSRRVGRPMARDRVAVLGASVVLAGVTAFRDAGALQFFGLAGALGLLAVGVGLASRLAVRRLSPISVVIALVACGAALLTSPWRLASMLPWRRGIGEGRAARARLLGRSLAIALPVLFVFGSLFVAADAVFAKQVGLLFDFDLSEVWRHGFWLLFGLWFSTAVVWNAAAVDLPEDVALSLPERHRLGRGEVAIVLGSLAALFALFVLVQVRYLFGGEEAVRSSVDLTYAEYARRGFFELVVASLLLLPLLAAINWARTQAAPASRVFLALTVVLVALLFVIMSSAWQRLAMYREAFGLTELRFYAAALLPLIGVALLWFVFTVARRQTACFLAGTMLLAWAWLVLLFAVNPEARIVETNLARLEAGAEFDAAYAGVLSADTVPALLGRRAAWAALGADDRCELAAALGRHAEASGDVRSWNWSRAEAARLIAAQPEVTRCP